jgi:hypothetical protein
MHGSLGKDGSVVKLGEVGEEIFHLSFDICHWSFKKGVAYGVDLIPEASTHLCPLKLWFQ